MLEKIKLDFDYSYFLPPNQDYNAHKGSCLSYQRVEQNDLYTEYGDGYSYDENNTVIQQLWYDPEDKIFEGWLKQFRDMLKMRPYVNYTVVHDNQPEYLNYLQTGTDLGNSRIMSYKEFEDTVLAGSW